MSATTIVVGPRTRAGQAVVERATSRGGDVFVLARHSADVAALSGGTATVLRVGQDVDLLGEADGPVRIVVCALGPVHPDEARAEADAQAFLRDLGAIERLLAATSRRQVGVVLISSVIALAPGPDRRYYGGYKALVEQQLGETIARTSPQATLSVVYPGRLVDGPARRVLPGLHLTYRRLASTIDSLAAGPARARVAGFDARLWLFANGLRLLTHVVLPPRPSTPERLLEQPVSANERYSKP